MSFIVVSVILKLIKSAHARISSFPNYEMEVLWLVYFHRLTVLAGREYMIEVLMVCILNLCTLAGDEPDEEGRPGGTRRCAADRLARLRGHEERCCPLR